MRKVYYHRIQNMQHAPGLNGNVVALCNPQTGNEFLEHLPDMTREQYEVVCDLENVSEWYKRLQLWNRPRARDAYEAEFGEVDQFKASYNEGFVIWSRRQRLEDWDRA